MMQTPYTAYPPIQLCSTETANSDVATAGPTVRQSEAESCAIPFVAPSDRLFGALEMTKMKMLPVNNVTCSFEHLIDEAEERADRMTYP